MSNSLKGQIVRFAIPFCFLVLVSSCGVLLSGAAQEASPDQVSSSNSTDSVATEQALEQKAIRVLKGFGEENPVAVVTAVVLQGDRETENYEPKPEQVAIESVQRVEEILAKRDKEELEINGLLGDDDNPPKDYVNRKVSENRLVGHTKTRIISHTSEIQRVSCLVQVSSKNAERTELIEKAVAVALGLDFSRGDSVLAVAQ